MTQEILLKYKYFTVEGWRISVGPIVLRMKKGCIDLLKKKHHTNSKTKEG
jgi:hypothetical protein